MTFLGTALTTLSPEDLTKLVLTYGPAVEALIQFIEAHRDNEKRAQVADEITRGLQRAKETGDSSGLESAIRAHCDAIRGCRLP